MGTQAIKVWFVVVNFSACNYSSTSNPVSVLFRDLYHLGTKVTYFLTPPLGKATSDKRRRLFRVVKCCSGAFGIKKFRSRYFSIDRQCTCVELCGNSCGIFTGQCVRNPRLLPALGIYRYAMLSLHSCVTNKLSSLSCICCIWSRLRLHSSPRFSTDSIQRLRLFYQRDACAEVPNQEDSWVPGPEHLQITNIQGLMRTPSCYCSSSNRGLILVFVIFHSKTSRERRDSTQLLISWDMRWGNISRFRMRNWSVYEHGAVGCYPEGRWKDDEVEHCHLRAQVFWENVNW